MTRSTRRVFASGAAAFLFVPAAAAQAVDVQALNVPPAIGEMYLGPADARVTIIEYASASCPNCASFHRGAYADLKAQYIDTGKIRFVVREYPHNDAALAAFMLARCGPKERYFPLLDRFFTTQSKWTAAPQQGLLDIALEFGFTAAEFEACINDAQLAEDIASIRTKAKTLGVQEIPTFFINGERYDGDRSFEDFKARIDLLLG